MGAMTLCMHELKPDQCDICGNPTPSGRFSTGASMAGKTFELVHIPKLRADTYLHLNREGRTWALRWYRSPNEPAIELGRSSRGDTDPALIGICHSISYPYSLASDGVRVTDSRYWFDEIAKVNSKLSERELVVELPSEED
jgi:hypothetical protein